MCIHPMKGNQGKEETIRVLSGQTKVCIKGKATTPGLLIPAGEGPVLYRTAGDPPESR